MLTKSIQSLRVIVCRCSVCCLSVSLSAFSLFGVIYGRNDRWIKQSLKLVSIAKKAWNLHGVKARLRH